MIEVVVVALTESSDDDRDDDDHDHDCDDDDSDDDIDDDVDVDVDDDCDDDDDDDDDAGDGDCDDDDRDDRDDNDGDGDGDFVETLLAVRQDDRSDHDRATVKALCRHAISEERHQRPRQGRQRLRDRASGAARRRLQVSLLFVSANARIHPHVLVPRNICDHAQATHPHQPDRPRLPGDRGDDYL